MSPHNDIYKKFLGNRDIVIEENELRLTDWGRVKHICVSKLTIIDSDNGLSPARCHVIIWTNAGLLIISHMMPKLRLSSLRMQWTINHQNDDW